jgi:hypothetical protein
LISGGELDGFLLSRSLAAKFPRTPAGRDDLGTGAVLPGRIAACAMTSTRRL